MLFIVQHMNIETTLTNANTITLLENNQIQLDNINSDNLLIKQFNGLNIQVYGTYDEPLFKAKDIGDLLGMSNIREVIKNFNNKQKVVSLTDTLGGQQNTTFLTEQGLYKVLMRSRKKIAEQFQDWVFDVIKQIRLKGKYDLEKKLEERNKQIEETTRELYLYKQKTYDEIEKTGHVYIIRTDGGYKVGKTKDINNRVKGLQTGNNREIEVVFDFKTSNSDLLEKNVHYILDRYRCNSNREFFDCNPEYIKRIITVVGSTIDTLKSCYKHISNDELTKRLESGVKFTINDKTDRPPEYNAENVDFCNWLDKNVRECHNSLLNLKDVCESYLDKKNIHSSVANRIRIDLESWIRRRFDNIRYIYTDSSLNGIRYKGWIGLELIGGTK
jgi:prophage antirepressor-like protein